MKVSEIKYNRYNVENLIKEYNNATLKINNASNVNEVLDIRNELINHVVELDTAYNLAYIRWSLNTSDEFYADEKRYYEENIPLISQSKSEYIKSLLNSKYINELRSILPKTLFDVYECLLKCEDPKIANYVIEENLEISKYSDFMSALTVEFDGQVIPFTILKKYMVDSDRNVRKRAYNSLGTALNKNATFLDENFKNLVEIRTKMAKELGYDNFVKLGYFRMNRICYGSSEIEKFRNNVIKYIVPSVCSIKNTIAKNLNVDKLKLYDNDTVLSNDSVKTKKQGVELFKLGSEIYSLMSKETGEFFAMMVENEAFDCLSRKNKWGGGYETELKKYGQPFILANFNNSSQDVDVLTHEAGHAYASYVMNKNGADLEIGLPCMDVAETHSMSMEFFCYKYLDKIFGYDTNKYKLKHFTDSFCFIPYGVMVDAFQEEVYKNYFETPSWRKNKWKELEKVFRPYMDSDGIPYLEQGARWQYQMHIYETPFYYIDYAIAQITALQFLFLSLEDYDLAFKKYNEFISYGCDFNYIEILQKIGLKSPFDEDLIKDIAQKSLQLFDKLFLI